MVGEFGEVLVMDWGVAKLAGGGRETGVIAPHYMRRNKPLATTSPSTNAVTFTDSGGLLAFLLTGVAVPKPLAAICAKARQSDPQSRLRQRHCNGRGRGAFSSKAIRSRRIARIRSKSRSAGRRAISAGVVAPGVSSYAGATDLFHGPLKDFAVPLNNTV